MQEAEQMSKMFENCWWDGILNDSHTGMVETVSAKLSDPKESVLDTGCGCGNLEKILFKKGFKNVVGIDISKASLEFAKKNYPFKFLRMDICKGLKFSNKSFDWVVSLEVLEHITNPVFVIEEMMRVGKKVVISCPNGFWTELRPTTKGYLSYPNYVHFTEKQLRNVVREFGGKITSFEYFTTTKGFLGCARMLLPRFLSTGFVITIKTLKKLRK
jgi:2-polyprenyl-3-methyl-5-hydroxy-6-metoxy-1,4-benzoquinol methylase